MSGETGMTGFISALTTGITSDTLWAEVTKAAPFIIGVVIFAFGYYVVRKLVKGTGKGKVRF